MPFKPSVAWWRGALRKAGEVGRGPIAKGLHAVPSVPGRSGAGSDIWPSFSKDPISSYSGKGSCQEVDVCRRPVTAALLLL